jgi:hypothetical protein
MKKSKRTRTIANKFKKKVRILMNAIIREVEQGLKGPQADVMNNYCYVVFGNIKDRNK